MNLPASGGVTRAKPYGYEGSNDASTAACCRLMRGRQPSACTLMHAGSARIRIQNGRWI